MNAPVLDPSTSPNLPTILEGTLDPVGVTVSSLLVDGSISGNNPVEAIAIEAVDTSLGTWQYSLDAGITWLTIQSHLLNSSTNTLGLLLGPTSMIRLLPFGELSGTLTNALTFRAWDMSSGDAGQYVVTTPGIGAFSNATDTASIHVMPVNSTPSFSPLEGGGKTMISGTQQAFGMVVQPDGKIVVDGYIGSGMGLVRLNADGSVDTGFSGIGNGINSTFVSGQAYSLTLQSDGKIVLAGTARGISGTDDFCVVRVGTDGRLDNSFGNGGKAVIDFGQYGMSVAIQHDGKMVVAGEYGNEFGVIRLNSDGSLDTTFATGGKQVISVGGTDRAYSVAFQPDGQILVSGYVDGHHGLLRLNQDGSLDTSFGNGGKAVILGEASGNGSWSMNVQSDGKIVMAGRSNIGMDGGFGLIRLNSDGTLDVGFGGSGSVRVPGTGQAYSVALQSDGKIVVAGGESDFNVARLNTDGSFDTSFGGGDGVATIPVGQRGDHCRSVSILPDGKIVLSGYSEIGSYDLDFSVVRLNADGSLDNTFNGNATATLGETAAYVENAPAVILDGSVAIFDADLAAQNGGLGNYCGASVTLNRHGGANAQDVFIGLNDLILNSVSGNVELSGVIVGTFSQIAGTLAITFNDSATQTVVNAVLSGIGYANSSDAPPSSLQIDWVFSDGNSGEQGAGGALVATGSTTIQVTATNDAPVTSPSSATGAEDTPIVGDLTVRDVDSDTLTYSLVGSASHGTVELHSNGSFLYTPEVNYNGADSFTFEAYDNVVGSNLSTVSLNVVNVNDAPTGGVTITGTAKQGQTLTATNTLADVDGLGTISYQWSANGVVIDGATSDTLVLGQSEVGKVISVSVSYTDLGGAAESVASSATGAVVNVNDAPTGGVTITGTAKQGQTLTANHTLVDVDGLGTISYQWSADGIAIVGASSSTIVLGQAEVGKAISVAAIYTDLMGTAERVASSATGAVIGMGVTLTGTSRADVLTGGVWDDTLYGLGGNDTLNGGAGSDTMDGGAGNDTYVVDSAGDLVVEAAGAGTDLVQASVNYTLAANVENLTLTGSAAINGMGNALANTLTGNSGNNALNGGTGNDKMIGGAGDDTYFVDATGDTVTEASGAGNDTVVTTLAAYTLSANVEHLTLAGIAASNGTGNTLANTLTGNDGANLLSGLEGNDVLSGGAGNDTLIGGAGNDSLTGGLGSDVFRFDRTALSSSTNLDTIFDFTQGVDSIQLENAIFKKLTVTGTLSAANFHASTDGTALDANDYIQYNAMTGALYYDADGSGAGAAIQFVTLVGAPAITAADFVVV
jgi:uncharacterized delta-60 repeat protein